MLVRIFEYATKIASEERNEKNLEELTVTFPHSAVIYLRHTNTTPDEMNIRIVVPTGELSYKVPVMKVQKYDVEQIFEKDLLFVIPFHIFAYKNEFKKYETDENKFEDFLKVYKTIFHKLDKMMEEGKIKKFFVMTIKNATEKVLEKIAKNHKKILEGVQEVMRGQFIESPERTAYYEGVEQGRSEKDGEIEKKDKQITLQAERITLQAEQLSEKDRQIKFQAEQNAKLRRQVEMLQAAAKKNKGYSR